MSHDHHRFVIVDGHGIIYRAYHAFPPLSTTDGTLVNAVYGFSRILLTAIRNLEPEYLAVAFDHKAPTKRSETFKDYKANRPAMPDDLRPQIEIVKEVVSTLNIPQFEEAGVEADDLIGSITKQISDNPKTQATIVTSDKDLLQLVDDEIHVWMPARGRGKGDMEFDPAEVKQVLGVTPQQIIDLKALMGDASDNIPGVKGIGKKTAQKLIAEFQSLNGVYQRIEQLAKDPNLSDPIIKGALLDKLVADKENAYLSQQLATIDRHVKTDFSLEDCRVTAYDKEAAAKLFEKLQFDSLIGMLPKDEFEIGIQNALF